MSMFKSQISFKKIELSNSKHYINTLHNDFSMILFDSIPYNEPWNIDLWRFDSGSEFLPSGFGVRHVNIRTLAAMMHVVRQLGSWPNRCHWPLSVQARTRLTWNVVLGTCKNDNK